MYKWGAAAAYCCARLLVARANRAVIVFAMFRSVFLPQPFSAVVVVFASFVPQSAHTTTNHIKPKQEQSFISLNVPRTSTRFAPFIPALALPTKKTTLHSKNIRQPCVSNVGCQRPHSASLHSGLSLSATLAPLADGSRLSLRQASKALHCVPLLCYLPPFGSRLLYLLCFSASPTHSPRPPTPNKVE